MAALQDILSRKDIEHLVDSFYGRVETNPVIGSLFSGIDWVKHKPLMYSFWASMMLGEQTYRGNPFEKHIKLSLTPQHFSEWLRLFDQTVDENFVGDQAEQIKDRARTIARVWQFKMGITS
jgi:hemoglobin